MVGTLGAANVSVAGVFKNPTVGIVDVFVSGGGPKFVQGAWDSPGVTHTVTCDDLSNYGDNFVGTLYLHTSSKSSDDKNGTATLSIVKSQGFAPRVCVESLFKSGNLGVFSLEPVGNALVVTTDAECAVCWTFLAAI